MAKEEYQRAKDLPIHTAVWRLLAGADKTMVQMDRGHKHTFGQSMVNDTMHMLTLISRANRTEGKARLDALRELLDVYDRVANTFKYCTERGYLGINGQKLYVECIPLLSNVERQAAGWFKKTQADMPECQR